MTNRFLVAAALLLCAIAAGQTESNPDLAKLRSRISALQGKLAESEKSVATLSEEVKRLDLKLEIAQKEAELVAATREEFARQLAVTRAERAASSESSQRLARAPWPAPGSCTGSAGSAISACPPRVQRRARFPRRPERLDSLARRDGSLLSRYRQMEARKEADIAREDALKSELDRLYSQGSAEVARMASLRRERETLLAREKSASTSRRDEVMALSDKAARLERLLQRLAQTSAAQAAPDPSGGIRPWRGVLDWPARGTLIETFGRHRHPKFDAWTFSNGIALGMPAGTPVRAVYSGRAIYAQWLAEYGNLVILDHGDGVFTLYAWLQSVGVSAGAYVPAGSSVGAAGWGPARGAGLCQSARSPKANTPSPGSVRGVGVPEVEGPPPFQLVSPTTYDTGEFGKTGSVCYHRHDEIRRSRLLFVDRVACGPVLAEAVRLTVRKGPGDAGPLGLLDVSRSRGRITSSRPTQTLLNGATMGCPMRSILFLLRRPRRAAYRAQGFRRRRSRHRTREARRVPASSRPCPALSPKAGGIRAT